MPILCHFPSISGTLQQQNLCYTSVSFPKIELFRFKLQFSSKTEKPHFRWNPSQCPARRNLVLFCSAENSSNKRKVSKRTKTNEELCDQLREFIRVRGLPEDRSPSLKEFSEHGRKDLANIVRRRGYKVITELLRNSSRKGANPSNHDIDSSRKDEASEEQENNLKDYDECVALPSDSSLVESCMVITIGSTTIGAAQMCEPSESPIESLHLKANGLIHTSDAVEGALEVENVGISTDLELSSESSDILISIDMEEHPDRDYAASGELNNAVIDAGLDSVMAGKKENQIEIDRLKAMLHQKEMELSLLKEQIEKEKQALSNSQAKANTLIRNAHRSMSAKDMELLAAEESLSGLKEVQIEYWANGETVEVSGSFNGWHHRIRMDPHPSSNTTNPHMSSNQILQIQSENSLFRRSKLWSTCLWLYPGFYEIKFIVDNHWTIDSQREIVISGNVTNNVLRVDR